MTVTKDTGDGADPVVNAESALAMTEAEPRRGTTPFETLFLAEYARVVGDAREPGLAGRATGVVAALRFRPRKGFVVEPAKLSVRQMSHG